MKGQSQVCNVEDLPSQRQRQALLDLHILQLQEEDDWYGETDYDPSSALCPTTLIRSPN